MLFNQSKKLPDLIRLSLTFDFLQVHQFRDVRMYEYMMASSDTVEPKTESFDQIPRSEKATFRREPDASFLRSRLRFTPAPQNHRG